MIFFWSVTDVIPSHLFSDEVGVLLDKHVAHHSHSWVRKKAIKLF